MNKSNKVKAAIVVSKIIEKIQLILGCIIVAFFGLGGLISLTDDQKDGTGTAVVIIIFIVLGYWLIYLSRKRNKLIHNFKYYVPIIAEDPTGSLENLAGAMGTSIDVVKKNLQKMIQKKYFVDAYLDPVGNRIVFPSMQQHIQVRSQQMQDTTGDASGVEYTTVTCRSCGAVNKIVIGNVSECEYCGTQIKG